LLRPRLIVGSWALQELQTWLLRRDKTIIAQELPKKEEMVCHCAQIPEQSIALLVHPGDAPCP
jgi:hypothetical protein